MSNNYELVLVLAPDLKDDEVALMKGQVTTDMSSLGAEIVNQDDWGKKDLAFEVKDFRQGYYHLYQFTAPPDMPGKLKGLLKVNEKVIRYLLTKWEPKAKPADEAEAEEPVEVAEETKPKEPVAVVEEAKPEEPVAVAEEAKPEEPVAVVEEVEIAAEPVAEVEIEKPTEDTENKE